MLVVLLRKLSVWMRAIWFSEESKTRVSVDNGESENSFVLNMPTGVRLSKDDEKFAN